METCRFKNDKLVVCRSIWYREKAKNSLSSQMASNRERGAISNKKNPLYYIKRKRVLPSLDNSNSTPSQSLDFDNTSCLQ